jgi:hypothetical protein
MEQRGNSFARLRLGQYRQCQRSVTRRKYAQVSGNFGCFQNLRIRCAPGKFLSAGVPISLNSGASAPMGAASQIRRRVKEATMRYALRCATAGLVVAAVVLPGSSMAFAQSSLGTPAPLQGTVVGRLHNGRVTVDFTRGDALGRVSVRGWASAAVQLNGHSAKAGSLAVGETIIAAGRWDRAGDFVAAQVRVLTPVAAMSGVAGTIQGLDARLQAAVVRTFDGSVVTGYLRPLPFVAPTGPRPAAFDDLRIGELVRLVGNADSVPDGQMLVTAAYPGMPSA